MKTIAYKEFGSTSVLQTVDESKPTINHVGEVLVRVKAVSINPLDWKIRKGEMKLMSGSKFPKHTGTDFSGVIEETGSSVTSLKKGDEVFGIVKNNMKEGALGEYVVVSSTLVWKKTGGINFLQAASIPTVGVAAVMAIQKMGTISGNTNILINGATGGFGMFLLQMLTLKGANITAVTGPNGVDVAKSWGANSVVDYKAEDVLTKATTYDVVVDLAGRMGYSNARKIMKSRAVYINPIPNPIDILTNPVKNLFRRKKHIVLLSAPSERYIKDVLRAIDNGLKIEVSKVFQFARSKEAYEYAEKGGTIGKVVIEVS